MNKMKNKNIEVADRLRQERLTTKEELLMWVMNEKIHYKDGGEIGGSHSAVFYRAYSDILDRLYKRIEDITLFRRLEDFWYYSIRITSYGAVVSLEYAPDSWLDETGVLCGLSVQTIQILYEPGILLTVEEYAEMFNTQDVTVRQWIRRGKIRTARKTAKGWLIPKLTERPTRGYIPAVYHFDGQSISLPEEYEFLRGNTDVIISQNEQDKKLFTVLIYAKKMKRLTKKMNTIEREKFELYLIADPDIVYIDRSFGEVDVTFPSNIVNNNRIY